MWHEPSVSFHSGTESQIRNCTAERLKVMHNFTNDSLALESVNSCCLHGRQVEDGFDTTHEINPLVDVRWGEFVKDHPKAGVFHSTKWLRALHVVYGYEPVVLTATPPRGPLKNGLVFCRIRSWLTGSRLVSLPFSDHCEPLVSNAEELERLLAPMRRYVDTRNWKSAEIRPISLEPRPATKYGKIQTYCFQRLDLSPSVEQLFRRFHKDCVQRKIRRAEKEKLKYEEGNSDELLQKFYGLLVGMRRRKSLPPQPIGWFRALVSEFGQDLQIRVASHGELPVASIITLHYKKTMTYKYGCSDAAFNKLGGMALLFWKAIQDAKADHCSELDLGRSDADNFGLIAFKEHWGATSSSLTYWSYPQKSQPLSMPWCNRLAQQVASISPRIVLETAGKILYKHCG
jgi:Acetyltransferase (GNAT) domain